MQLYTPHQVPGLQEPVTMPIGGILLSEEVILTLTDANYLSGTAININTGVYAGGGPTTVEGSASLTLPAAFNADAGITVLLNGQEIKKGTDVIRLSSTQVSFSIDLFTDDQIKIRALS